MLNTYRTEVQPIVEFHHIVLRVLRTVPNSMPSLYDATTEPSSLPAEVGVEEVIDVDDAAFPYHGGYV